VRSAMRIAHSGIFLDRYPCIRSFMSVCLQTHPVKRLARLGSESGGASSSEGNGIFDILVGKRCAGLKSILIWDKERRSERERAFKLGWNDWRV